jgi:FkbM family methyltransferase
MPHMTTPVPASLDGFRSLLSEHLKDLTVVDVGAHGADGGEVYSTALSDHDRVIGFEPNVAECERLNLASARRRYFPHAIGDGLPGEFKVCSYPLTSSLLEPNTAFLKHYENLAELCVVVDREPMQTRRLDDIEELHIEVDFLKLDIQGGTLAALSGAEVMLTRTLIVHAETEFAPIYQGEPLFTECERFLRERGFMFHHFHRTEGRRVLADASAVGISPSQLLWADSVFVPTFERLKTFTPRQLVRFAWLMFTAYSAVDWAMLGFSMADGAGGTNLASAFRQVLAESNLLSSSDGPRV